ncbi:MAG: DUF1156 domain-containing protein, partial [Sedimentisphaerales bacterium]|nr:DUF1156 domain-containing protein [Sedimentisphaerales bacterium]
SKYLQEEGNSGRLHEQLMAVATISKGMTGKQYRVPTSNDVTALERATDYLQRQVAEHGEDIVPHEPLKAWSGVFNAPLFGLSEWGHLFNARQLAAATAFVRLMGESPIDHGDHGTAVRAYLTFCLAKVLDRNATLCTWQNTGEKIGHVFGRQALPMIWDYVESNPIGTASGNWEDAIAWNTRVIEHCSVPSVGVAHRSSADRMPIDAGSISTVATDPPYYDAVPYSDLSDFFYVWHKRVLGTHLPDIFRTPLTPKASEMVSHLGKNYPGTRKTAADYETAMEGAFKEMHRVLADDSIASVMFAHKTTTAWESIIGGLIRSGLLVTGSWPLHTEMTGRLRAMDSAALASSVSIICRKRATNAGEGLWDDVRSGLREVANERLDFFWDQGIRGADFFISAIGPALSVFGQYERVVRLSGEDVTVGQFLDEVRDLVTHYALNKIVKGGQVGHIDAESQFYVVWKWSYADAKIPADEAFKLSQALGFSTEEMWDKTGVLEKSGQNVSAVTIAKRMKIKNLGEPKADGVPSSLIDVLHRLCAFRDKGDATGAGEFLARSGHGKSQTLWLVAQAVSEILPDGDKEKQLLQGLLNQRESLQNATQGLF